MIAQRHRLGAPERPAVMTSRLLVLTERSQLPAGRDLVATVASCVDAGATHVVLRELDLSRDERADLAAGMVAVGATVIAAHEALPECVGVHLPAVVSRLGAGAPRTSTTDATVVEMRAQRASKPLLVGRSCHSADEVEAAAAEGADYATLSPYAATESKPGYGPPLPPDAYADHPIPVYALGGVTPDNAAKALAAGAHGVAVMGRVMRADDPGAVVASLLEEVAG